MEHSLVGTFAPVELSFLGSKRVKNSLHGNFVPVELSFVKNEYSKNLRSESLSSEHPKNDLRKCDNKPHNSLHAIIIHVDWF